MTALTQNPIAALFEGQQVMLTRERRAEFESCIALAAAHPKIAEIMAESQPMAVADDGFWPAPDDWRAALRPYQVQNGILLIPVRGVLLHNFPWQMGNWATGYDYIWRALQRGLDDANVRGIAFVIHSPGGLVAGNQVLVDRMYARRGEKPMRAFAAEGAYSAAYNIFSVPEHGVVSPTGGVGSIGVMTCHIDWSKWNEQAGLKYTFIFAGEYKVDGNPEEPLSQRAKDQIQERVDELYDIFVASVARNRGMDEKAIRATKAGTFTATQATSNGLADSIGALDDALSAFADVLDDDDASEGDEQMTTDTTPAVASTAPDAAALDAARNEGAAAAATATQARIKAIVKHEEAEGRTDLAEHLAYDTDLTVEAAVAMLAKAPKATAAAPAPAEPDSASATFQAAMDKTPNPTVGAGADTDKAALAGSADPVLALVKAAGIGGFKCTDPASA